MACLIEPILKVLLWETLGIIETFLFINGI